MLDNDISGVNTMVEYVLPSDALCGSSNMKSKRRL